MAKKATYLEGDCFSVPLRQGGFARGVIARMDGDGIIFGYFFGPLFQNEIDLVVDVNIEPGLEILQGQFGDLGLLKNEWKIIGHVKNWDRKRWTMPQFLRCEEGSRNAVLSTYDENSLEPISEEEVAVSDIDVSSYLPDRLMGYGSVEIRLTRLLAS